ncbi:MAG: hypothetical protein PHF86_09440 [Candidatus Nanoarchaeia archaeon]|jgi:hypothetical protein|nr:hypothetical protein [Candidatus Nanoarchaeia archaeon]
MKDITEKPVNEIVTVKERENFKCYRRSSPGFFGIGKTRKEAQSNFSSKEYSILFKAIYE